MTSALFAALAVCVVVIIRMWITARTDKMLAEYPPRRYLDTGLALIAVASVVRATGAWIDASAHHQGLADLGWRLPVAAAGSCMILYLEAQRTRQLVKFHRIVALVWPTLIVIILLVMLWNLTSFGQGNADDVLPAGDAAPWAERLYIVLFDLHLLTWTVPLSIRNWELSKAGFKARRNATARAKSTAKGQAGMAIAAGSGSVAVAITITRALTVGSFTLATETHLHTAGTVLSYIAPAGAAVGIGFPAVANLVNGFRTSSLLQHLDQVLHSKDPHSESNQTSRSPIGIRLQPFTFAIERHRTRITDKFRTVVFSDEPALRIVTDEDPEAALGAALSDPTQWNPDADEAALHRAADKLLPPVSNAVEALNQLIA